MNTKQKHSIAYAIILFAFFSSMNIHAAKEYISQEAAWNIVKTKILRNNIDNVNVYVSNRILMPYTCIKAMKEDEKSPEYASWFFFIDDIPLANWEHSCRYVFVDATSSKYQIYAKTRPPFFDNMHSIKLMKSLQELQIDSNIEQFEETNRNLLRPTTPAYHDYAVIISGGANTEINYERYWNDCSAIYRVLRNIYLYPKNHIYVLISDGTNTAIDRHLVNGHYDSSPVDLDYDGVADTQYAATKANIQSVFTSLGNTLTPNDNLFIFTTDHGGGSNGSSYLNLWNNTIMMDYELATEINKVNAGHINICMEQCYSGGFLDNLAGTNRVVTTACNSSEYSYAMSNALYDEYAFYWISAVGGYAPTGGSVNADTNSDSKISMYEAYQYALNHDSASEHPQYSSTPTSLGNALTLSQTPNLKIIGDKVVCDSSYYYVEGLPSCCTVTWSVNQSTGAPNPSLQNNYPSQNQCIIRNTYHYPTAFTLIATIKHNGNTVLVLTKKVSSDSNSFYGTYEQEACTYYGVNHPAISQTTVSTMYPHFIHQGCQVTVQSNNMRHHTVTHDGVTPEDWLFNEDTGTVYFKLPLYSAGSPFTIWIGGDGSCNLYKILFFSMTGNGNYATTHTLETNSQDGYAWSFQIVENADNINREYGSQASNTNDILSKAWKIEIYDATTGRRVLSDKMNATEYNLSTIGWKRNTYVVRVFSGENVFVKKISVK